jgi:hypothetical protein
VAAHRTASEGSTFTAYLDEMCFRFNNHKNSFLFRDTLLKTLEAGNVGYKKLISAA